MENIKKETAIIMPAYNCEKTIAISIQSIIRQSYKKWELFIVDDKSNDSTPYILDIFPRQHKNINIIRSDKNEGPSSSRNKAINAILNLDFKYIAYCDSDDTWDSSHLENNIKFLEDQNADMVYSNVYLINENYFTMRSFGISNPNEFDINELYKGNFIYISSVIHKIQCLSVGLFDSNSIEDWDYWIRIAKNGYSIKKNNNDFITYMVRKNSFGSKSYRYHNIFKQKHPELNF